MFKIGHGYDVHRFDEHSSESLIKLGGIDVPSDKKLLAHSDGDVVLHALCDALLGAIAAGDIGEHFPDTDAQFAGADSRLLLRQVLMLVQERGFRVGNVDITIAAQAPRLQDFKRLMAKTIAADLNVTAHEVNVKATTTEKLGFVGRKEGIAVDAVCLLMQAES